METHPSRFKSARSYDSDWHGRATCEGLSARDLPPVRFVDQATLMIKRFVLRDTVPVGEVLVDLALLPAYLTVLERSEYETRVSSCLVASSLTDIGC